MSAVQLRRRPFVLIVRDGWGHNPDPAWDHANAIRVARTPVDDRLMATYPHTLIQTSGEEVGLPAGVMGNSEVGHQNIGAGRVVDQEILRISKAIREETFFQHPIVQEVYTRARKTGGNVHLMGLCSDAGVHSALGHLYGCVEAACRLGFPGDRVFIHAFGDGRDTPPDSGVGFIREVEARLAELGAGQVASVVGRYYAMDRDNRWDRVEKAYAMLTRGVGHRARSAVEAFERYYAHPTEAVRSGDEFVEPTLITTDGTTPRALVRDGDSVLFFNFRGDRPRELTKAFTFDTFPIQAVDKDGTTKALGFDRGPQLDLYYATMTAYEKGLPVHVIFEKPSRMKNILGEYLGDLGLRQFRTAETEKFPHVTFFFNDYRDEPYPGEDRKLVPSPRDVTTYDQKPEMSAPAVTEVMLEAVRSGQYDLIVLNYANCDMVGHSGNLAAAVQAVEAVDTCVGRVVEAVQQIGGHLIVTADHGNCEMMIDPVSNRPHTAHTTFPVPAVIVDDGLRGRGLRSGGTLADLIPTALEMMDIPQPAEMTGRSLLLPA